MKWQSDCEDQIHEDTDWIPVILWRSERLAEFMTKCKQVYVEGRLQTRSYDDCEGVKRYVTEVVAQNIVLLGGGENGSRAPESPKGRQSGKASNHTSSRPRPEPEMGEMVDDSVPFQNGPGRSRAGKRDHVAVAAGRAAAAVVA